jgi:hypothetical protein
MVAILGMALFAPSSLGVPYSIMDTYTRPPPSQKLTPLREFTMLRLMNIITDKPQWNNRVKCASHQCVSRSQGLSATSSNSP